MRFVLGHSETSATNALANTLSALQLKSSCRSASAAAELAAPRGKYLFMKRARSSPDDRETDGAVKRKRHRHSFVRRPAAARRTRFPQVQPDGSASAAASTWLVHVGGQLLPQAHVSISFYDVCCVQPGNRSSSW